MIQVDNEINSGILWPDGHTWDPPNWNGLAELLTAGYNAVKDYSPETLVMLHIAEVGASYYPSLLARDTRRPAKQPE